MSPLLRLPTAALLIIATVMFALAPGPGLAASPAEIDAGVDGALATLHAESSEAMELAERAAGILVFPKIIKGGLIIGAQAGEGALRVNNETAGYYNTVAVSYGLQIGVQWFGYAMYFMNEDSLDYLHKSKGWEVGTGPSIVIVDTGAAGSLTSTSLKDDVYVFFFEQKGLMAGLGLQGTKITEINPD
jgi:lipid-binding SYLF domain-containing protein